MPRIRIRRFRLVDLDRLLQVERASFPKAAYPRDLFLELLRDCGSLFFVATLGGSIAGYMVTCTSLPRAELVSIAVDRRWRRMGIAQALIVHTLAKLRLQGASTFSLMVRAANRGAIALYSSLGFRRVRRVAGYYENGEDGVRMRLTLPLPHGRGSVTKPR